MNPAEVQIPQSKQWQDYTQTIGRTLNEMVAPIHVTFTFKENPKVTRADLIDHDLSEEQVSILGAAVEEINFAMQRAESPFKTLKEASAQFRKDRSEALAKLESTIESVLKGPDESASAERSSKAP